MKFPTDRPVKVVMLGAGGTGGYVAPYVFRLLHMLDRPSRFVVCDGDIVEPKNLDRQNFVPADLGENKARVLAERYSTVLGMETEYVPSFIEKLPDLMELIEPKEWELNPYSTKRTKEMVLLLGCVDNNTLWLEELASAPMSIRSLAEMPEERYALPDHPIEVNTFKGERFNQKELEQQLRRCNSFAQMMARSELDSGVKRPLLPLSISQIGLIGGSGMINGLIACDTPHIIKGRIVKVIRTESEEKFSAQGNHIGSEVKETITNKMIFNVLTPNGFKALT